MYPAVISLTTHKYMDDSHTQPCSLYHQQFLLDFVSQKIKVNLPLEIKTEGDLFDLISFKNLKAARTFIKFN